MRVCLGGFRRAAMGARLALPETQLTRRTEIGALGKYA